jgi:uncharacterized OB-fold protein
MADRNFDQKGAALPPSAMQNTLMAQPSQADNAAALSDRIQNGPPGAAGTPNEVMNCPHCGSGVLPNEPHCPGCGSADFKTAKTEYIFEGGNVTTVVDGHVVASVKEAEFGGHEEPAVGQHHPGGPGDVAQDFGINYNDFNQTCPDCGAQAGPDDQWCPECGSELGHTIEDPTTMPAPPADVQHDLARGATVVTPNGLKGQVLGKVASMWGDEVTVRLENGRIVRLPVTPALRTEASVKPVAENKVAALDARLASSDVTGTRASLVARLKELRTIQREAKALVSVSSHIEAQELDRIVVQAEYELGEVQEAIAHLADTEAFEPPAPFRMEAVEQAAMGGHSDSTWLDHTMNEMIAEAEATDYERLMDEGPEAFVAGLDDAPIAHAATTRVMATDLHP